MLRTLDANRDGKISAEEMNAGRTRVVRERVAGLIEDLDADRDGKVSKEEARGQIRADFEQLDENRDGHISREELFNRASAKPPRATDKPDPKRDR
jgi:Ca2+-binding EF-hand superfamily protein